MTNGISKQQVEKYIRTFIDKMIDEEIPAPFISDCWMCHMSLEKGKSIGDLYGDPSHIEYHIIHEEYVPSMLLRSMVEDPNISETTKQIAFDIWRYKGRQYNNLTRFKKELSRALLGYISKRARVIYDEGNSEN